jgi:hypothetical protein
MSEGGYPKPDRSKAMQNILITCATGLISNATIAHLHDRFNLIASIAGPASGFSRYENTFRLSKAPSAPSGGNRR